MILATVKGRFNAPILNLKKTEMNNQKLFSYMSQEHNVILLQSEMQEIINFVLVEEKKNQNKMKKIFNGLIDQNGNLKIHNAKELADLCKEFSGSKIFMTIETTDQSGTIYQMAYFRNVICSRFQQIFIKEYGEHMTQEKTTDYLLRWSIFSHDDEGERRDLESLSKQELSEFIDHCKRIASKEFDTFIE